MKNYFQIVRSYIIEHKKDFTIGISIAIVLALIAVLIVFIVNHVEHPVKIVYQPAKACELLTLSEASELLGDKTLNSNSSDPVLSGNTATSKCGYTNGDPDINKAIVAAIIVRSGINDAGVEQNKTEFVNGVPADGVVKVKDVGDNAYFNQSLGQLNILDGRNWIIVSYGVGSDPTGNTLDDALKLAQKITAVRTTQS